MENEKRGLDNRAQQLKEKPKASEPQKEEKTDLGSMISEGVSKLSDFGSSLERHLAGLLKKSSSSNPLLDQLKKEKIEFQKERDKEAKRLLEVLNENNDISKAS